MGEVKDFVGPNAEVNVGVEASRRAQNCMVDIKNALNKWKCIIDPMVQISHEGGVQTNFRIVPLVERPTA